jgi:uncharacterized repeat protein (TIGR01451 family)
MKKNLLILFFLFSVFQQARAQFPYCYETLVPNTAFRGQTLTTSITNNQLYMGMGSAPCNPTDVSITRGATTIYASTLSVVGDSIYCSWNIPANAPNGVYTMNIDKYNYDPVNGNCFIGPNPCFYQQAFSIGLSKVSGIVYYDANQDATYNTGDVLLNNIKLLMMPDSIFTFTNYLGQYSFLTDSGAHSVILLNDTSFISNVTPDTLNVNVGQVNINNQDFGTYQPASAQYQASVILNGRQRCNTNQPYTLTYSTTSFIPVDLLIKVYHSPNTPFTGSNLTPDSIAGDTIYYSVQNLVYSQGSITMNFNIPALGDTVHFNCVINSYDQAGNYIRTTAYKLDQVVRCSFDPNDKAVNPSGEQAQHYTLFGEELFYTIRFQNTGTDTAYDVHVLDTIDANLDLNTMQLISTTHPLTVEAGLNGVIDFQFYNIMLPDSNTNSPGSNGSFTFSIRPKPGLAEMTIVTNKAYIYFDQNLPVITNETDNMYVSMIPVGVNDPVYSNDLIIYPNPFNSKVTFATKSQRTFNGMLMIMDLQGRELMNTSIHSGNKVIDLQHLSTGIYLYKIFDNDGNRSYFGRLIKQ